MRTNFARLTALALDNFRRDAGRLAHDFFLRRAAKIGKAQGSHGLGNARTQPFQWQCPERESRRVRHVRDAEIRAIHAQKLILIVRFQGVATVIPCFRIQISICVPATASRLNRMHVFFRMASAGKSGASSNSRNGCMRHPCLLRCSGRGLGCLEFRGVRPG